MLLVGVVEVEFRCAQSIHYCVEDTELTSSKSSNHNATGQESNCAEVDKSNLLGNVHQTSHHWSISTSTLLVNLGEKSISRAKLRCHEWGRSCGDWSLNRENCSG